ncbi:unnamed protein product [Caenorhabditis bovis]|uniref:Uncharacterized protein n=1 Tax=Caenorhabditis bovis TaxID=2654633 RepID=A0A8S1F756_9PELO|nr:unnamed protein product [Caenorhabditis bovis]
MEPAHDHTIYIDNQDWDEAYKLGLAIYKNSLKGKPTKRNDLNVFEKIIVDQNSKFFAFNFLTDVVSIIPRSVTATIVIPRQMREMGAIDLDWLIKSQPPLNGKFKMTPLLFLPPHSLLIATAVSTQMLMHKVENTSLVNATLNDVSPGCEMIYKNNQGLLRRVIMISQQPGKIGRYQALILDKMATRIVSIKNLFLTNSNFSIVNNNPGFYVCNIKKIKSIKEKYYVYYKQLIEKFRETLKTKDAEVFGKTADGRYMIDFPSFTSDMLSESQQIQLSQHHHSLIDYEIPSDSEEIIAGNLSSSGLLGSNSPVIANSSFDKLNNSSSRNLPNGGSADNRSDTGISNRNIAKNVETRNSSERSSSKNDSSTSTRPKFARQLAEVTTVELSKTKTPSPAMTPNSTPVQTRHASPQQQAGKIGKPENENDMRTLEVSFNRIPNQIDSEPQNVTSNATSSMATQFVEKNEENRTHGTDELASFLRKEIIESIETSDYLKYHKNLLVMYSV